MFDFPRCLLIVTAEVDHEVEAEWNRWYDTVHLPDALKGPGVLRGRRYVSVGDISETAGGRTEEDPWAHLHDHLRARQPARHDDARVPGHARLVPVRPPRPLSHADHRAGRLV